MKLLEKCNKILQRRCIYMQGSHQNASHSCTNVPSNGEKLTQTEETCVK